MKNVIIIGSGRSGTSLTAGMISDKYYKGEQMVQAWEANPKGFYEDKRINRINEQLLSQYTPNRLQWKNLKWGITSNVRIKSGFSFGHRWLCTIPSDKIHDFELSMENEKLIKEITNHQPFCLKDPRFSHTLETWRPYLKNTVFLCVFRKPMKTAVSMKRFIENIKGHDHLQLNTQGFLEIWHNQYRHILDHFSKKGQWIFLHYNQIGQREKIEEIENIIGAPIDTSVFDIGLKRSKAETPVTNPDIINTYKELCRLANYDPS